MALDGDPFYDASTESDLDCRRCGTGSGLCDDCAADVALEERDEQESGADRCPPRE